MATSYAQSYAYFNAATLLPGSGPWPISEIDPDLEVEVDSWMVSLNSLVSVSASSGLSNIALRSMRNRWNFDLLRRASPGKGLEHWPTGVRMGWNLTMLDKHEWKDAHDESDKAK